MKKHILIFFLGLFNLSLIAGEFDTIPANNLLIEYSGRIDFSNELAPRFSFPGVSIRAEFQGKSISFILSDDDTLNFYNVILDDSVVKKIQTRKGVYTYQIDSALKDTIHEIELFKRTEHFFGTSTFIGFILEKGKTLVPLTNKRERIIEFIGNSITSGYGNEGTGSGSFSSTTENNYLAYGAYTARDLNARYFCVSASGIGLYKNYCGDPIKGTATCMLNYYNRINLKDSLPLYDFKNKPNIVCIDLGTNDFSCGNGDSSIFINKYLQFIEDIQLKNDSPDIICLVGPIVSGGRLDDLRRYITFVVDSSKKKNRGAVYFFELSQQKGDLGYGLNGHPSIAQHKKNSKELCAFIRSIDNLPVDTVPVDSVPDHSVSITNIHDSYVVVYPNPTFNNILNYRLNIEKADINVYVYNMQGELIKYSEFQSNNGQIDLRGINSGCYIVKFKTNNTFYSKRFVLK